MMGSGKTSSGKALAKMLGLQFIDLDSYIEKEESIAKIFEEKGEEAFRKIESEALAKVLSGKTKDFVLALGGGTILGSEAAKLVEQKCFCVYLKAKPETLAQRLGREGNNTRPLLSGLKEDELKIKIEQLLAEREAKYQHAAALCIGTDGLSSEEVAKDICKKMAESKQTGSARERRGGESICKGQ